MSGTTALLSVLSGALQGRQDRRFREEEQSRFDAEQKRADLFDRLKLLSTPGVVLDDAPGPEPVEEPPLAPPGPGQLAEVVSDIPENIPGEISETPTESVFDRVSNVVDVGDVSLGGEDLNVGFDPDRTLAGMKRIQEQADRERKEGEQRQAFEQLPPAEFGEFNPGIDYIKELNSFRDRERKAVADEENRVREDQSREDFIALTMRVNPGMSRDEAELLARGGKSPEGPGGDEPARLEDARREISMIRRSFLSRGTLTTRSRSEMIRAIDAAAKLHGFVNAGEVAERSKTPPQPSTRTDDASVLGRLTQSIREHPGVDPQTIEQVDTILGLDDEDATPQAKFEALETILQELEGE